ncbi:16S rRNA (cytidine(1402)-2'-O)-methyltransferase [Coralliovum pocilloporae]|uniref:16S rRNA (cytidine(1402)-2'-O)-methyltransferase n=1 Tax=Coralliovum pocilloporae TaxID=3066369 RepID=UPI003307B35B
MSESEHGNSGFSIGRYRHDAPRLEPGLYIVATPIGNLRDITVRALETLAAADLIACEDTRVSRTLLNHFGISARLIAYHEHNAERQTPVITTALADGKCVALISDAGTPLISDPGYRLVTTCLDAGHVVVPIPGPSALTTALCAAGLPTDRFLFSGFLPNKSAARRKQLSDLAAIQATLVFYEAPSRIVASLDDMCACLGPQRTATLARELTKRFEEFRHDTLENLATSVKDSPPKGEIVVMVAPDTPKETGAQDLDALLTDLLSEHRLKDAVTEAVALTGLQKRMVYQRALELSKAASDAP